MTKMTLYGISEEYVALYDMLDEMGGDITDPSVEQAIDQIIQDLDKHRDAKLDGYAGFVKELLARAEMRKKAAENMAALAKVDERLAAALKERLQFFFELHGLKRVDTERFRVTLNNNSVAPLEVTVPAEDLPAQYRKVSVEADRKALREAINNGETVSGVTLGTKGKHIRIK